MNELDKLVKILQSDEVFNIETNGNFMGTRRSLAEYLINNGVGLVDELRDGIDSLKKENASLKMMLQELSDELLEVRRNISSSTKNKKTRKINFKINKR